MEGLENSLLQLPADSTDRSQNVWQWILESDRQAKHKPHRFVLQLCSCCWILLWLWKKWANILKRNCCLSFATLISLCLLICSNCLLLQHSKCKEIAQFGTHAHAHLGRWRKQWASPCPPARTPLCSGPRHATSTPSQHLSTAWRSPQTPRGSFQTLKTEVCHAVHAFFFKCEIYKTWFLTILIWYGLLLAGIQHQAFRETRVTQCLFRMAVQHFQWRSMYIS